MESIQINNIESLFEVIPDNVLELIKKEYAVIKSTEEAEFNNKCQHVKLVLSLRQSNSAGLTLKLIKDIEILALDANNAEWLVCSLCKYKMVCSHVIAVNKLIAEQASYKRIDEEMTKYYFKDQSGYTKPHTALLIEPIPINFCKVCMEEITKNYARDITAKKAGLFGFTGGVLRAKIWGMSNSLFDFITFPYPVDPKSFAKNVSDVVNTYIIMENENNTKWKNTIMKDIIDNQTTIDIAIYICAYILELISISRRGNKELYISLDGVSVNAKISEYFKKLISIITETYRGIISRVTEMSMDYIENKLKHAFKVIHTNGDILITIDDPITSLANMFTSYDYIFKYAENMAKIEGEIPYDIKKISEVKTCIKKILGKDLETIITGARDNINNPKYKGLFSKRAGIKVPPGSSLKYLYKDDEINIHSRIFELSGGDKHKNEINTFNTAKVVNGDFIKGSFYLSYELFSYYTKKITNTESEKLYMEKLEEYRKQETLIVKNMIIGRSGAICNSKSAPVYREFRELAQMVPITMIYDESGSKHEWDINSKFHYGDYVFNTVGDIKKNYGAGKRINDGLSGISDISCSVCGCKYSELGKLDIEKTKKAVDMAENIDLLFDYYANRCPVSDIHVWAETSGKVSKGENIFKAAANSECKKCGIGLNMLNDILAKRVVTKNQPKAVEYYFKFNRKYQESAQKTETNKVSDLNMTYAKKIITDRDKLESVIKQEISKWEPDFTYIAKVANLARCSTDTILAMGSTDGRDYRDIVEGKNTLPPPTSRDSCRIYSAESEVRLALSEYSVFRRGDKSGALNRRYYLMYEKNKISKAEVIDYVLSENIELTTNYAIRLELVKLVLTPDKILSYIIEMFCRIIVEISEYPGDKRNIMKLFASETAAIMVNNQKLFAKPEKFDINLLNAEDDNIELLNGDDVPDDEE